MYVRVGDGKVPRGEESWTRSTCSFGSGAVGRRERKGWNEGEDASFEFEARWSTGGEVFGVR